MKKRKKGKVVLCKYWLNIKMNGMVKGKECFFIVGEKLDLYNEIQFEMWSLFVQMEKWMSVTKSQLNFLYQPRVIIAHYNLYIFIRTHFLLRFQLWKCVVKPSGTFLATFHCHCNFSFDAANMNVNWAWEQGDLVNLRKSATVSFLWWENEYVSN